MRVFSMIVTKKYRLLLLVISLNVLRSASCPPGTKRKELSRPCIAERRALLEKGHFNDYKTNTEVYKEWPELDRENLAGICRLYLSGVFIRSDVTTKSSRIRNISLLYLKMEDVNITNESDPIEVVALECELLHPRNGRRYVQFVRSPNLGYVYTVKGKSMNRKKVYNITGGVRLDGVFQNKRTSEAYNKNRKSKLHVRHNDTPEQQLAYEKDHYDDYYLHNEVYEKWPELENVENKEEHCRKLLKKILPKSDLSRTLLMKGTIRLGYPKLKKSTETQKVKVAEIVCQPFHQTNHNRFHFIRAPKPNCQYLVKQVNTIHAYSQITKQFCDDDNGDDEEKSKTEVGGEELPNSEVGSAIDNNYENTINIRST